MERLSIYQKLYDESIDNDKFVLYWYKPFFHFENFLDFVFEKNSNIKEFHCVGGEIVEKYAILTKFYDLIKKKQFHFSKLRLKFDCQFEYSYFSDLLNILNFTSVKTLNLNSNFFYPEIKNKAILQNPLPSNILKFDISNCSLEYSQLVLIIKNLANVQKLNIGHNYLDGIQFEEIGKLLAQNLNLKHISIENMIPYNNKSNPIFDQNIYKFLGYFENNRTLRILEIDHNLFNPTMKRILGDTFNLTYLKIDTLKSIILKNRGFTKINFENSLEIDFSEKRKKNLLHISNHLNQNKYMPLLYHLKKNDKSKLWSKLPKEIIKEISNFI